MRSRLLRARWTGALAAGRPADAPEPAPASAYDPEWAARILLAATDGLQLQWLLDPSIDMAADMGRLRDLLLDVRTPCAMMLENHAFPVLSSIIAQCYGWKVRRPAGR